MKLQLAEAKRALDASIGLLNSRRTDRSQPQRLERELERLKQQREAIDVLIDRVQTRMDNADELFEQAQALVHKRQQELKRLQHRAKIERLIKLKRQLDDAGDLEMLLNSEEWVDGIDLDDGGDSERLL